MLCLTAMLFFLVLSTALLPCAYYPCYYVVPVHPCPQDTGSHSRDHGNRPTPPEAPTVKKS